MLMQEEKNTTLYLVRHGTTYYNEKMCFQGSLDAPLNELGIRQGALLEDYFKDIPIDLAVTSPLIRARHTLELLLGDRKDSVPILEEPDITEIDGGVMEGLPFRQCNVLWPEFMTAFNEHPGTWRFPDGESGTEVYNRVSSAICRIARENPGKTIAMVSHGFSIQTWLNFTQGIPADDMREWVLDNVAVSKFTFGEDGAIAVDYVGDNHHLTDDLRQNYDWDDLSVDVPIFVHYPKCSTCRKARQFLDDHGIRYQARHIVEEPLKSLEILQLMDRFDGEPKRFFNTSGQVYRGLELKDKVGTMDAEAMAELLATNGMLVKRPLLIFPDKVLVGFKEDAWRKALDIQ